MKKKPVTKENQLDLFGIDPTRQDKPYKSAKSKVLDKFKDDKKKETQKQLQEKQKEAKRQEEERLIWDELPVEGKLARMREYPESTDMKILEGINEVLSYKGIESFSVNGEFFGSLRDFFLQGFWDIEEVEIVDKKLVDSFNQFYRLHKDSQSQLRILTEDIIKAKPLDYLLEHFFKRKINVHGKDWFKHYLPRYLDTYTEEAKFLQDFITSALYDSDRRYRVSKSMGKIRIVWYIDQRCLGSDGIWGRSSAISVFFDRGHILQHLGEFHIQKSPKAIKDNIFAMQPHAKKYLKQDMEKDYLAVEFWKLEGESLNNISDAWEGGELGKVEVDRTENSISLEWEYPSSFYPYDKKRITNNCFHYFRSITDYMFNYNNEDVLNMIRDAEGGW